MGSVEGRHTCNGNAILHTDFLDDNLDGNEVYNLDWIMAEDIPHI